MVEKDREMIFTSGFIPYEFMVRNQSLVTLSYQGDFNRKVVLRQH